MYIMIYNYRKNCYLLIHRLSDFISVYFYENIVFKVLCCSTEFYYSYKKNN